MGAVEGLEGERGAEVAPRGPIRMKVQELCDCTLARAGGASPTLTPGQPPHQPGLKQTFLPWP